MTENFCTLIRLTERKIFYAALLLRLSWGAPEALLRCSWGAPGVFLGRSWGTPGALLGCSWGAPGIYFNIY